MMDFIRQFRVIPVLLVAVASLAVLKILGIMLDGGYLLNDLDLSAVDKPIHVEQDAATGTVTLDNRVSMPQPGVSWAQDVLGFPDVTGSTPADRQVERNVERMPGTAVGKPERRPDGRVVELDAKPNTSPSERAILQRLQERRQELDSRGREIDLRENLLKAAERKIESRATELRDLEASAGGAQQKRDEADAQKFKNLVTMYESMKAKDAARIFDRLEMRILVEVASQMNPRRMSDVMGQMSSEAAERLTVELANRATAAGDHGADLGSLPKIEGTPRN
jgi:flagellar motility protein MotE (MotC chaperone)